jgi:WD40 repeat protein/transcriptional regulator with XRE-family HTH domain
VSDEASGRDGIADPSRVHTRQDFARELTWLRERAGLTVRDVAKALGIPDSTVGGYFGGRHLPPVKPPDLLWSILGVCGLSDADVIEDWLEALTRVRRAPGKRPAGAPVPYRGLASFQPEDADWFYGRQKLTNVLARYLRSQCATGGLLVAVGPSGSGKSSLLRAGMIPMLQSGALGVPGSDQWPIALFTPGSRPLHQLAEQLVSLNGADADADRLAATLLSDPGGCRGLALQPDRKEGFGSSADSGGNGQEQGRVVLVVDQFEEIFTACPDETERRAFIAALCATAEHDAANHHTDELRDSSDVGSAALIVLGLRADFYPHALRYPELVQALQDRQVVVGPMTEAELRSVIVEPARKAKLDIEDGLVEVLLRDLAPAARESGQGAAYGAGSLPLLSHALLTTWQRSRRGRLTVANYMDSGGIQGAVARTADEVYDELTGAQQDLARQIFLRLVHVANDTADTRRRASRNELLLSDADAQLVLECFIDKRLITSETDEVEIAHEALLSAWPRLRGWIDADRDGVRLLSQLSTAAQIWRDSDRDPNALYRGVRLATAKDWASEQAHHDNLNILERSFLDASVEYGLTEERAARRRTRRLQSLSAALAALTLAAGFLSIFAFQQKSAATNQRNLAISRQVAIDANQLRSTDVALAMQLSLAAYRIAPTPEARSSLLESYTTPAVTRILGPPGVMQSMAFTRNGRIMAAGGENSTIRLWNTGDMGRPVPLGRPLTGDTSTVFSVAFSPDGRTLASGSGDKTVRLWNVTNPAKAVPWGPPLTGPANTVYSVAFSPNGQILAAGSADDTVRLWNVTNPGNPIPLGTPLHGPAGFVQSVAFSPNGHILAAGSADDTARLWNITNPRHPIPMGPTLTGATDTVFSVAFSPDGRTLAVGSADDKVQLWHISDPLHPTRSGPPLTGPTSWINSVAFSPDGRSLAAASSDSKVWIWNLATRKVTSILPHPAPVTTVTFLRNSNTVATSAADGVARIWRIPGPLISGPTGPVFAVSPARSHLLAVTSTDNTARLWNIADPRQPILLGSPLTDATRSGPASGAAALSPDGSTLVVGAVNGTCQVWDVQNPARPLALSTLHGPTADVQFIEFSPNGRMLAVTGNNDATWLWNIADPSRPVLLGKPLTGLTSYGLSVAFSPNERLLAVGGADKLVHLWDISNPSKPVPLRPLTGSSSYVDSVAFSPDGYILAAGSADDKIRLWGVTDPRRPSLLGQPLTGPTNYVYNVAFNSDGDTLAATAGDGSIWLWNVTAPSQPNILATLTGPSGAVFIDAYVGNMDILATGGADGLVRLWNTNTSQVAGYVCSIAGDSITRAEWAKYISGLPYDPPC